MPLLPVDRVPAQSRPEAFDAFPSEVFVQSQRDARRFNASAAPVDASRSHADEAPPWHPVEDSTADPAGVGALLYAAKPVQWRGDGELLSLPFRVAKGGLWLVVDLWAGFSGLLFALLSLGIRFIALSAEQNPEAVAVCKAKFPNVIHVNDVRLVNSRMFHEVLKRRNIRGMLVGGGSPCQGNSSLNRGRQSLQDPRSQMPVELRRLLRELASDELTNKVQVYSFLECCKREGGGTEGILAIHAMRTCSCRSRLLRLGREKSLVLVSHN